ncbi:hemolysin family protein [Candidatus Latescibacterota bacterium]
MPGMMLIVFIISLPVSVMFSGAEIALGSISRDSLEKLAEGNVRGASIILGMFENKRRFLLMLLFGKVISIVTGTVFLFGFFYMENPVWNLTAFTSGLLTIIVSVFAYTLTEGMFSQLISTGEHENRLSRFSIFLYFLIVFNMIFLPFSFLIDYVLSILIKKKSFLADKEEALIELVKSETEAGVIEQDEQEMIESIMEFSDTTVKEVMVPRIDMVAAEDDASIDELLGLFESEGHSRIPIYEGRVDHILGFVYAKDLLAYISEKHKDNFTLKDTMRDAYFVPENKKISELLEEFKKSKVHIAIVVDEYGGTAGIVALEDLLEEIVGEIQDEYDQDERDYIWMNDRTLLIDAGLDIDDVNEIIRTNIPNENFDTLGGFIYHQLGFIPEGGEEIVWENITFKIKEIIGNRISKVVVVLSEPFTKNGKNKENDKNSKNSN